MQMAATIKAKSIHLPDLQHASLTRARSIIGPADRVRKLQLTARATPLTLPEQSLQQAEKMVSAVIRGWLYEGRVFRSQADGKIDTLAAKVLPAAEKIRDQASFMTVPAYLGTLRVPGDDVAEILRLEQLERDMCVFSDLVCQEAKIPLHPQPNLRAKQARKYLVHRMLDSLDEYRAEHLQNSVDHILDVGFGSGYTSACLAKRYPSAQVTGLEASGEAVALRSIKQDHKLPNLSWRYGFAESLPMPVGSVDIVTMLYMSQQMPVAAFSKACFEASIVLRPGGTLMIAHPTAMLLPAWGALLQGAQSLGLSKDTLALRAIANVCDQVAGGGQRHPDCTPQSHYKTLLSGFFDTVVELPDLFPGHQVLLASNKTMENYSFNTPPNRIGEAVTPSQPTVINR